MSNDAYLSAGTITSFSVDDGTTWTPVPKIDKIGAIGDAIEAKEVTSLDDTRKVYGVGLKDSPDKSITGKHLSSDPGQKAFIAACKANTEMLIKHVFPDGGTEAEYTFLPLGFTLDDATPDGWQMFTVTGKQNSDVAWTEPA